MGLVEVEQSERSYDNVEENLAKNGAARRRRRAGPAVAGTDGSGAPAATADDPVRTAAAHGLHVHAEWRGPGTLDSRGRRRRLRNHAASQAAREPQERLHAARESLEREDRRPQRPLAEGAGVAFRRLRGAHLGRRSRFRRHSASISSRRSSIGDRTDAAQLRTGPRSHAHRHRYGRRRLRAHVRIVHLLARSAHAGPQGNCSAARVRPFVPLAARRP